MISLKESLLKGNGAGITNTIKKFLIETLKIDEREFTIRSNYEIELQLVDLNLNYDDFGGELPEYIKFADDDKLSIRVTSKETDIKSFRGLPRRCERLIISTGRSRSLPKLDITLEYRLRINSYFLKKYEGLNIIFVDNRDTHEVILRTYAPLDKNVHITGVNSIDFVNDFNLGEKFSKAMSRKAEMNKGVGRNMKFKIPISSAGEAALKDFFDVSNIDISQLEIISYTQNSQLRKGEDGKWYRFKNW